MYDEFCKILVNFFNTVWKYEKLIFIPILSNISLVYIHVYNICRTVVIYLQTLVVDYTCVCLLWVGYEYSFSFSLRNTHWRIPRYQYTTYCTILYLVIFTLSWGSPGDRVNNPKGMNRQFPRNSLLMPIWTQTTSPYHLVTNPWFPPCPSFVLAVPSCVSHWSFSGMNLSYPFTFWFINSFK